MWLRWAEMWLIGREEIKFFRKCLLLCCRWRVFLRHKEKAIASGGGVIKKQVEQWITAPWWNGEENYFRKGRVKKKKFFKDYVLRGRNNVSTKRCSVTMIVFDEDYGDLLSWHYKSRSYEACGNLLQPYGRPLGAAAICHTFTPLWSSGSGWNTKRIPNNMLILSNMNNMSTQPLTLYRQQYIFDAPHNFRY